MKTQPLEGKVAIITATGAGIGQAIAIRLAAEGAKLVINDIRPDWLGETTEKLDGGDVATVVGDVASESTATALVEAAMSDFGRIDVLANVAGVIFPGDITTQEESEWRRMIDVNLVSMFYTCKHVIPVMANQHAGSIINIGSVSGYKGQEIDGLSTFAYNATKAAVHQLTRSLATRHGPDGIRVNAICPGSIRTRAFFHLNPEWTQERDDALYQSELGILPVGRLGRPEDVAAVAMYLASDDSTYITGHQLFVEGGQLAR
jgi:NAD(P)-dependent dehydrogenase (short-subunit alcohol dehydrogenase family)